MNMAEEFARCKNCQGGWFREDKQVLISKLSPRGEPDVIKTRFVYFCGICGDVAYTKENN